MGIIKTIGYGIKVKYQEKKNKTIKPRWIFFEVTENCNSRCKHCNIWRAPKNRQDLTLEQIEKAFNTPFMSEVEYIMLTGGEPTTRDDLLQIYEILHKCCPKATLQLSTNGINYGKAIDVAIVLLNRGIPFQIGISLDGYGSDHDKMRGIPGNFENVERLIRACKDLKTFKNFDFCVGMTVSDLTAPFYPKLKKYVDEKKLFLEYAYYNKAPFYSNETQDVKMSPEKIRKIVMDCKDSVRKEAWLGLLDGKWKPFKCYSLKNFLVIKANGNIVPCLTYSHCSVGNIKNNSFETILSSRMASFVRDTTIKNCPGCLNTWAYSWSASTRVWPFISYYLRHPKVFFREIFKKGGY